MKTHILSLLVLSGLAFGPLLASDHAAPAAQTAGFTKAACGCPQPTYVRASADITLAGQDYVELDTDAGDPIVVTLAPNPAPLDRVEIWLGDQPGLPSGNVTIAPNGHATTGATLLLDEPNEGRLLLFVKPTPTGAGYWRVTQL